MTEAGYRHCSSCNRVHYQEAEKPKGNRNVDDDNDDDRGDYDTDDSTSFHVLSESDAENSDGSDASDKKRSDNSDDDDDDDWYTRKNMTLEERRELCALLGLEQHKHEPWKLEEVPGNSLLWTTSRLMLHYEWMLTDEDEQPCRDHAKSRNYAVTLREKSRNFLVAFVRTSDGCYFNAGTDSWRFKDRETNTYRLIPVRHVTALNALELFENVLQEVMLCE